IQAATALDRRQAPSPSGPGGDCRWGAVPAGLSRPALLVRLANLCADALQHLPRPVDSVAAGILMRRLHLREQVLGRAAMLLEFLADRGQPRERLPGNHMLLIDLLEAVAVARGADHADVVVANPSRDDRQRIAQPPPRILPVLLVLIVGCQTL